MRPTKLLLAGLALSALLVTASAARADDTRQAWYEVDAHSRVRVNLFLFWSETCPHCARAITFAKDLVRRRPWVNVYYYETTRNPANLEYYRRMAASLGRHAGSVPAFFFCKDLEIGYDSYERNGARIERSLVRWYEALSKHYEKKAAGPAAFPTLLLVALDEPPDLPPDLPVDLPPEEPTVYLPGWGEVQTRAVSLPLMTVVLAGCDAFNPCAFFVLLFLLSLMVHGHSRWRMLVVGGVFVFFSALMYFLFMAAWLNLFLVAGHLPLITGLAGLVALVAAALNIKDFFWFKQGPSLSIPESARPGLFQRMTRLIAQAGFLPLLAGTAALAALANLYELLCTSGLPMVFTRVLTLRELPVGTYYLYLVLYNVVYVVPLGLIVLAFAWTLGARKLSEYEGRVLKLLSGIMMLLLGGLLLVRPALLSTVGGAVGTLALAVALTAAIVAASRGTPAGDKGPTTAAGSPPASAA